MYVLSVVRRTVSSVARKPFLHGSQRREKMFTDRAVESQAKFQRKTFLGGGGGGWVVVGGGVGKGFRGNQWISVNSR